MKKFPKVKYPNDPETDGLFGDEVVVLEKLDGANFRTTVEDGEWMVGTKNTEFPLGDPSTPKAFRHAIEYITNELSDELASALERDDQRVTLFGEAMHRHSITYSDIEYENPAKGSPYPANEPNVVFFDAWVETTEGAGWMNWDAFEDFAAALPLPVVPLLERGKKEELSLEVPDESVFGGQPEGIVVRRVDGNVRAKKVTDDFREKNAIAFDDPSKAQSDAVEFVAAYITKPRIEKTTDKLVDEGHYDHLQMEMMQDLPAETIKDAFAEIGWSELMSGPFEAEWDDEFKSQVWSKTSKKCARILKNKINEF